MDSAPPLPVTVHTLAPRKWNNLDFAIMKQILRALRGLIVQDKRCQGSEDDAKVCGLKSLCRFMAELHRLGTFFFFLSIAIISSQIPVYTAPKQWVYPRRCCVNPARKPRQIFQFVTFRLERCESSEHTPGTRITRAQSG